MTRWRFSADAAANGYTVVLCFIGLASADQSDQRVAMRVSQGGHDVPADKIRSRFPRTLSNLHAAILQLPHVMVFDNSDLARPFGLVATYENGQRRFHVQFPPRVRRSLRVRGGLGLRIVTVGVAIDGELRRSVGRSGALPRLAEFGDVRCATKNLHFGK